MADRIIGSREFTDGVTRPVYETDDCRQYVLDDEGNPEFGQWLLPRDEMTRVVREKLENGESP